MKKEHAESILDVEKQKTRLRQRSRKQDFGREAENKTSAEKQKTRLRLLVQFFSNLSLGHSRTLQGSLQ
jgi:hypothetical protein